MEKIAKKIITIRIAKDKFNEGKFVGFYRQESGTKRIEKNGKTKVVTNWIYTLCKFHRDVKHDSKVFIEGEHWKAEVVQEFDKFWVVIPFEFDVNFESIVNHKN